MRRIAGTLALVALTFSLAESVWASTCEPCMGMEPGAAVVDAHPPAHGVCPQPGVVGDSGERSGHDCPFDSPLAAQSCTGMTSMPGVAVAPLFVSPGQVDGVFTVPSPADLLLGSAPFHPPRA